MALRVKCKCGKVLQVSSKLADKRVSCTGCGAGFVLPKSRFVIAQKKPSLPNPASQARPSAARSSPASSARPSSASAGSSPPPAPSPRMPRADELDTAQTDLNLEIADLSGTISPMSIDDAGLELSLAGDGPSVKTPPPPPSEFSDTADLEYARDPRHRQITGVKAELNAVQAPVRGFWSDAVQSFVYPLRNTSNLVNFVIIGIISLMGIPLGYAGIFGLIGSVIIFGWLSAMYLSVVQDTAVGSDDMPGIKMEDGFFEDVIKPALKYIGAYVCAIGPFAFYSAAMLTGALPGWMASPIALLAWMAGGFFLWPIFVLLFAFNALGMIFRLDLIFTTIFRTFLPYIAIWIMILFVGFLWTLPFAAMVFASIGLDIPLPEFEGAGIAITAGLNILNVALTIVTMRLIGLYYLHFKSRFTLEFE